jgi:hypothetical protein
MANIAATLSLNVPAITALTKGEPGNSILNGTGAPTAGIGNSGDFYIDTLTFLMYGPKSGGIWGAPVQLNDNSSAPMWNSSLFTLTALSASWTSAYTVTNANSANWNGAYTTARVLSSDTTLRTNSAFWSSTYTTVRTNSASWGQSTDPSVLNRLNSVYTTVSANSAAWGTGGGGSGDPAVNALVRSSSGNWESTYGTVAAVSGNWNSTYNTVRATSGNWNTTYTFVNNISSTFQANSGQWNSAYTVTNANSASWNSTTSTVSTTSAAWNAVYTVTALNSGGWNYAFNGITLISPATARWDSVSYNYMFGASANYDSTYTTVASLSDYWMAAYDGLALLNTVLYISNSNIGIGTSTPGSKLTVVGDISATGSIAAGANWNNQTTNYVIRDSDCGGIVALSSGGTTALSASIPNNNFRAGYQTSITRLGTGTVRISAGPSVNLRQAYNLSFLSAQYSVATLTYSGNPTVGWVLFGDLA